MSRFAYWLSLTCFLSSPCYAAFPNMLSNSQINTVNNGPIIQSGVYLNTEGNYSTFKNTAGTGLWLKSGSNIRGVESDVYGDPSGNGGAIYLEAPNQVVRLDGNIDVRGLLNNSGQYTGSGGKVYVDAAYLYQSGNIYADGTSGGLIQFNVGSATLTGTARIQANGVGDEPYVSNSSPNYQGGTISINSRGPVDIQKNTTLVANGQLGDINIEGSLVNVAGIIQATGAQYADGAGGTVQLVSTGQYDLTQTQAAIQTAATNGIFSSSESTNINNTLTNLVSNHDGDIIIAAPNSSNTTGGYVSTKVGIFAAERNINNGGWILADGNPNFLSSGGEPAGVISLNAASTITNTGRISASGVGPQGSAGIIALSYKDGMSNSGSIAATSSFSNGGGLIDFSGPVNPSSNGLVAALSYVNSQTGGTIVLPNPSAVSSNTLIGVRDQTEPNEILYGGYYFRGLIFLNTTIPGRPSISNGSFETWIENAKIRSNYDQFGFQDEQSQLVSRWGASTLPADYPVIISSNDGSSFTWVPSIVSSILNIPTSITILTNGPVTIPNYNSVVGMGPTVQVGYNYTQLPANAGQYSTSTRGRLSIISNSLTFQSGESFTISDQTDYSYPSPAYPNYTAIDMGPGSVDIALKTPFTGSTSNFIMNGADPSLIITTPNP